MSSESAAYGEKVPVAEESIVDVVEHVNPLLALAVVVPVLLLHAGLGHAVYVIARTLL